MKEKSIFEKPDLKDVFDIDPLLQEGHTKICVLAGVGAGKSTWVKEVLTTKGNVLWVTSRKAPVEQITNEQESIFKKRHQPYINDNQTHVTNALLEKMIQACMKEGRPALDEFVSYYDFIVVDEAHALVSDSTYAESSLTVMNFAEYVSTKIKKPVIFMTGTPEPIQHYLERNNWYICDFRKICKYVHPAIVAFKRKEEINRTILKSIENGKLIYFANHVKDIVKVYSELIKQFELSLDDIAVIVSKNRQSDLKNAIKAECKQYFIDLKKRELESSEQEYDEKEVNAALKKVVDEKIKYFVDYNEDVYQSLINKKLLPESCKILLATSTLREGVNIFNENITIICDNHIMSNVIQFWGRVRLDGTKVYMIEDSESHSSQLSEMLYGCAPYRAEACNKYLEEQRKNNSFDMEIVKKQYIKYTMESNHYVYFNWIADKFLVAHSIYREEKRIMNEELCWLAQLRSHCDEYNIASPFLTYKEILEKIFPDLIMKCVKEKIEFTGTDIQTITNMINDFCGITHSQHSKLSYDLQTKGISVEIIAKKYDTKEQRGKVYWYFQGI